MTYSFALKAVPSLSSEFGYPTFGGSSLKFINYFLDSKLLQNKTFCLILTQFCNKVVLFGSNVPEYIVVSAVALLIC